MFTVTITKTTIEERPAGVEWEIVGHKNDDERSPILGYTPEIVKKREVEQKIYEQTVDEIDVKRVIDAVNSNLIDPRGVIGKKYIGGLKKN